MDAHASDVAHVPLSNGGVVHKRQLKPHIRWMIRRDMPEVLEIEGDSFEFPWSEGDFIRCLRQRNCIGMVAEHKDRVIGYFVYELCPTQIILLTMAVKRTHRKLGVGRAMVAKIARKLTPNRRSFALASVQEANLDAQLFLKAMGFRATLPISYDHFDGGETAYVMRLNVPPSTPR